MIILYHGSDNKFKQFIFTNVGKKHGTSGGGFGIYLTTSKKDAALYGKYCYTVQAELKKELSSRKITFTKTQLRALLRKFEQIAENSYIENYEGFKPLNWTNEDKAIVNLLKFNTNDVDIINDIINATNMGIEMMQVLKSFGFTHSIDNKTPQDNITTNYIIYDLDCLRIQKIEDMYKSLNDLYQSNSEKIIDYEDASPEFRLERLNNFAKLNQPINQTKPEKFDLFKKQRIQKIKQQSLSAKDRIKSLYDINSIGMLNNIKCKVKLNQDSQIKTGNSSQVHQLFQAEGKSKSKSQRRLFALCLKYKRGELDKKYVSDEIKKIADSMSEETLHDFAATKQKKRKKNGQISKRNNIPDYVKGSDYRPELKNSKSLKPQVKQKVLKNKNN